MIKYKNIILLVCLAVLSAVTWQFLQAEEISSPQVYQLATVASVPPPNETPVTTLIAVGDIMLGRTVEQKMVKYKDWTYPFKETYQITTTGDIVFANLEAPIIEGPLVPNGSLVFRTKPEIIKGLQFGGFNVLSLANNHLKNQGTEGIAKTKEYLDQADILYTGAGSDYDDAHTPAIIEKNGVKFGFLAYTDISFTPATYEATDTRSGSPFLNIPELIDDLTELKNKADILIVSMHAGIEYSPTQNDKQENFARTAIDNGASLVIGHHPHVVQPVEEYNQGYILYSLGNFIFDQMWSEPTREGAMAKIIFQQNTITGLELIPIRSFDYSQPRVLNNAEGNSILERMGSFTF